MKEGVRAKAPTALALDEQETSDPGAGSRPLSSVVAVVGACADGALADRPKQA